MVFDRHKNLVSIVSKQLLTICKIKKRNGGICYTLLPENPLVCLKIELSNMNEFLRCSINLYENIGVATYTGLAYPTAT